MRGEILHYDVEQGIGFIAAEDGNRYLFSRGDLMQSQRVGKGTKVDFRPDTQNAREVYVIDPRGPAAAAAVPARSGVPNIAASQPLAAPGTETTGQAPAPSARYAPSHLPPTPDRSLWGHFVSAWTSNYVTFQGRARRKEYWGFALFYMLALFILSFIGLAIDGALGNLGGSNGDGPVATVVVMVLGLLFFFLPGIAITVRRFHDVGLSGWLYLLFIVLSVIYIGGIIIFVISLLPSQRHDNKWGPPPEGIRF